MSKHMRSVLIAAQCLFAAATSHADILDRETVAAWLVAETHADAPLPGSLIAQSDLAQLRAWLPPGYYDEFDFPEVTVEIQETARYPGHISYREATARYAGQAAIGADGRLENYTAGRPFADEQISAAPPEVAGRMVAWNQIHRWQYTGYKVNELTMAYLKAGGASAPLDATEGLDGGGALDRMTTQKYHRVYLSKLAWLADAEYRFDVPDSDTRFFKDYIEFLAPFNVKGTKFVVERALDPNEEDQVNTYLPTERRVRRVSARERADSFMGSNSTLDDFDGFSGRVLDYTWHYLGRKQALDVSDTKHEMLHFFGPRSRVPNDRWQLRDCHVVEVVSTWEEHPYRSRVLLIDSETYDVVVSLVFNRDNQLWKIMDPLYQGALPEDAPGASIENSVSSWRGQNNIDLIADTTTVVRARSETTHPSMTTAQIKRAFDVSSLTSGQ